MAKSDAWNRRDVLALGMAAAATIGMGGAARAEKGKLPTHITDGQVHIWKPGGKAPSPAGRQEPFSAEQLLAELDGAHVERAVIVTPSWSADGNEYPLASAEKYPDRLRVTGLMGIPKPEDKAQIENWTERPGMAGMRMFLSFPKGAKWLASGDGDWVWPILERKKVPLMIHAGLSLPQLAGIAEKHPGLKICLDAFGLPTRVEGADAVARFAPVAKLAKYPNIVMKTGSIPFMSTTSYPYTDIEPLMRQAYEAFGPKRLIFASDITLLKVPYKDCVNVLTEYGWMSDRDRELIMGENISDWLNWPLPT